MTAKEIAGLPVNIRNLEYKQDKEKAIEHLKLLKEEYWDDDGYGHETELYDNTMFALDMGINAISSIDKIRDKIKNWQDDMHFLSKTGNLSQHDDEHNEKAHDFIFERIYEIFDEYTIGKEE